LKLVSEANANTSQHWRVRSERARKQRSFVAACWWIRAKSVKPSSLPLTITITRVAPGMIRDTDNLTSSAKHVRDQIAECIGVDDSTPLITWRVEQRKGKPREYAAEIVIEPRTHDCVCRDCGRVVA
jgi:hypothetical protein